MCKAQGIEYDAVNEPLPEQISTWGNDTRKIWADVYIDDRAIGVKDAEAMLDARREALQEK